MGVGGEEVTCEGYNLRIGKPGRIIMTYRYGQ